MNKIIKKKQFSENVFEIEVEAPLIARSRKAGHFVIVRVDAHGERIPLTIADSDNEKGSITLVVQRVGVSSAKLCALSEGDTIADIVGPLGKATKIEKFGTVVCACGGVGAAPMLPIARAMREAGNKVIVVLAARTKQLIILEEQLREVSDELVLMTDDGSYGNKGLVTNGVEMVIGREKVDRCITIGPAIMMKFVALLTKKYEIPTEASLNTIMVDGTGMCGACRVTVDGKTRFVCVDGPEFDAHKVDFDEMLRRAGSYRQEEIEAYEKYQTEGQKGIVETTLSEPASQQPDCQLSCDVDFSDTSRSAAWREQLRRSMKAKDRVQIDRVEMPELDPQYRATKLHEEVNRGLTSQMAQREAQRCLDCANPTCVTGCPVNISIPDFVKLIEAGQPLKAAEVIKRSSSLPAVCGRVCPQEKQCEAQCIHHKMNSKPVAIGYLERFAADAALKETLSETATITSEPRAKRKVAVIGSGPAGLTFAGDMVRYGYSVTVFEALHEIGGVLKYGIPEYRLPNAIVDAEIASLRHLGVTFVVDTVIGKTLTIDDLLAPKDGSEAYAAVFVATGAGLPRFMGIEGENLIGVMSSNEYLTRVNLMQADSATFDTPVLRGKHVAVIGGGNTAMDAVRTAKRLGAETATIVYRRSEAEMPARIEEVKHAKEEGVDFLTLHNPIRYEADEKGRVCRMELQVMELGEPDESGRRSPVPVEGKTVCRDVDLVIVAVGVSPNPIIPNTVNGLSVSRRGTIEVNDDLQTSIPVLYAGGDIVRGGATVILAMADGRRAAAAMHKFLQAK